jgi:hypothetical protein
VQANVNQPEPEPEPLELRTRAPQDRQESGLTVAPPNQTDRGPNQGLAWVNKGFTVNRFLKDIGATQNAKLGACGTQHLLFEWLTAGVPYELIVETCSWMNRRAIEQQEAPGGFQYFHRQVLKAHAEALAANQPPDPTEFLPCTEERWVIRIKSYLGQIPGHDAKWGDNWGPNPDHPDCKAPAFIIENYRKWEAEHPTKTEKTNG